MTYLRGDDAPAGSGSSGYDGYGVNHLRTSVSFQSTYDDDLAWQTSGSVSNDDVTPTPASRYLLINTTGDYWVWWVGHISITGAQLSGAEGGDFDVEFRVNGSTTSHRIGMNVQEADEKPSNFSRHHYMTLQGLLSLTANDQLAIYTKENTSITNLVVKSIGNIGAVLLKAAA